jgi:hypothetical protein
MRIFSEADLRQNLLTCTCNERIISELVLAFPVNLMQSYELFSGHGKVDPVGGE